MGPMHFPAFIPSPSNGTLELGPLPLHAYGFLLALGVLAAVWLAEKRWAQKGHDPREIADIAIWVVIAGVLGARLYHVVSDYELFQGHWIDVVKIWEGGLSIWGAVLGGAIAVAVLARRRHFDTLALLDAIAPAVVLAQAIGRWGNYTNQELFGGPSRLPWAVAIDPSRRPPGYAQYSTFQPMFLYESLWCLLVLGALLWAEKRFRLRRGQVFTLYIVLYTAGRFVFENMRVDAAHIIFGMRLNAWVSLVCFVAGLAGFVWLGRRPQPEPSVVDDSDSTSLEDAT